MDHSLRDRIRNHLGIGSSRQRERSGGGRSESAVKLFECTSCERTYISEGMDACPECRADLVRIPTERDLDNVNVL